MKENVRSLLKTGAILLSIGFICTLLLSLCNYLTKDKIARLSAETEKAAMTATLPEAQDFVKYTGEYDGIVTAVYAGKTADKKIVGYCVKAEPVGYGGAISMIVGINTEGVVTGVDIVEMSETPGLGAKADDTDFTDKYKGKTSVVSVIKSGKPNENQINAISGATVTSKAVTQGVNSALEAVEKLSKGGTK